MIVAELPGNEKARLKDLYSYHILDSPAEADFDALVELASQICRCPISLISILDKDRQWFKAKRGLQIDSIARELSFCAHAILQDDVMVVENALDDGRFADNPFIAGKAGLRFYAGAPIISPTGHKLGTICIIDNKPRTLTPDEEKALNLLSRQVTRLLEIRRQYRIIQQQAEDVLHLKQRAIKQVIEDNEQHKKEIAYNLHENFAQEIASSMMYLNAAELEPEKVNAFIKKAKEQLNITMSRMRDLSTVLTPLAVNWLSPEDSVAGFAERTALNLPFAMTIIKETASDPVSSEVTIAAIRILEQWLKVLSLKKAVHSVSIHIAVSDSIELRIADDDQQSEFDTRKKEIVDSTIYDKVHAYGGTLALSLSSSFTLSIKLPLAQDERLGLVG